VANVSMAAQPVNRRAFAGVVGGTLGSIALSVTNPGLAATDFSGVPQSKYSLGPKADRTKVETFLPQIDDGYKVLQDLEKNWKAKTEALDGDVVRRLIGTVGVTSPLFNIRKALTGVGDAVLNKMDVSDETVETLQEASGAILDGISAIDFQLYSVNFTELLPTKEKLINQGKQALDQLMIDYKRYLDAIPRA